MADPANTRGRVLFADDDEVIRRPMSIALRRAGFDVTEVSSAQGAREALSAGGYDVVLADIHMPGNEQLELLQRDQATQVPIILITGYPTVETAVGALRQGVQDYVSKPVPTDELAARLDAAVHKSRALQGIDDARRRARALLDAAETLESAVSLVGVPVTSASPAPPDASRDPLERLDPEDLARLSPRERDVVRLLAVGHPVQEIATLLTLSANTVRNHIKSVFTKLRVNSQVALLGKIAGHNRGEAG